MRFSFKCAASILLSTAALFASDLTITYKVSGKAGGVETQYMSASVMRTNNETSHTDTMLDFQKGMIYTIKHKDKTIESMKLDDLAGLMDSMASQMPAGMEAMMGQMFGDPANFQVVETGKDTVLNRPCNKVTITVGKIVQELSLDPTLKNPISAANMVRFARTMAAMMARVPMMAKMMSRMMEAKGKLTGVELKSHMTGIMGMDVTKEATALSQDPIPASAWALPAGYAMKDMAAEMRKQMSGRH